MMKHSCPENNRDTKEHENYIRVVELIMFLIFFFVSLCLCGEGIFR